MLVYSSSIDLSSRTLRFLTSRLAARRAKIGTRWRRLAVGRQALLTLAHLRCGDTYAQLAAGFGSGLPRSTAIYAKLSRPWPPSRLHSPIRSDACSGPRPPCPDRPTTSLLPDTTESSTRSPRRA
jgi:hypothetical protein